MTNLPYIGAELLGIGGELKSRPEHFQVIEIPLYEASGEGQHIYLTLQRQNQSTNEVVKGLQQIFKIPQKEIGVAGLKDKNALTTQTFSLSLGRNFSLEQAQQLLAENENNWKILNLSRHENKIRTGHLVGNQFKIVVSHLEIPVDIAYTRAFAIREMLFKQGVPNYYGPQRFGTKGDNAEYGEKILRGEVKERKHKKKKFLLSSFQSMLFNEWLAQRIESQLFHALIEGDQLQNLNQGRCFPYLSGSDHIEQFNQNGINYTGPIFGPKMVLAEGQALAREIQLLEKWNLTLEDFGRNGLAGTRRSARILIPDLEIQKEEEGLVFLFTLPAGSYATSVLREFMKND